MERERVVRSMQDAASHAPVSRRSASHATWMGSKAAPQTPLLTCPAISRNKIHTQTAGNSEQAARLLWRRSARRGAQRGRVRRQHVACQLPHGLAEHHSARLGAGRCGRSACCHRDQHAVFARLPWRPHARWRMQHVRRQRREWHSHAVGCHGAARTCRQPGLTNNNSSMLRILTTCLRTTSSRCA